MATDDLDIHIRLKGARDAAGDAKRVRAEVVGLGNATDRTGRKARGMGRGFVFARKGLGPLRAGVSGLTGALGFTAGVGLIGALGKTVTEAREAQKAGKATAAALKSTGASAWISRKQIESQAESLSNLAAVDDEVIQKSENMLLTFRDIRNEGGRGNKIFNRTTRAALDLAAGMEAAGKSMTPTDAALQLGKALNDPVKGMGRLQRIGITFTDQQVKQVEAMTKVGDTLGAQKVILREVNKEFGGQAKSQADPVKKLGVIFSNLAETVGVKLLPYIDKAAEATGKWVKQFAAGTGQGGRFRDKLEQVWKSAKPVVFWFGRAIKNVFEFASAHPDLVKVGTAFLLINKALKLMRFGSAISGVRTLIGWLGIAERRAVGMPGKVSATRGAWRGAGRLLGGVFAASFIAQLAGIEDADPLLFLHPPEAGGGPPKRKTNSRGNWKDTNGTVWHLNADGTSTLVRHAPSVDRGPRGVDTHRPSVDRGPRGVNPPRRQSVDRGPRGVNPKIAEGDVVHHTVVQIGDRPVWEAWERHDRRKGNRK